MRPFQKRARGKIPEGVMLAYMVFFLVVPLIWVLLLPLYLVGLRVVPDELPGMAVAIWRYFWDEV